MKMEALMKDDYTEEIKTTDSNEKLTEFECSPENR